MNLTPAIFLDRDNTLTIDGGYGFEIEKFQWVSGAPLALHAFHKAGIPVFVVTNQGGIGRGLFTVDDMHFFHQHLHKMTRSVGGEIKEYTRLQADAREEALQRLITDARKMSANAVINVRFTTSVIMLSLIHI